MTVIVRFTYDKWNSQYDNAGGMSDRTVKIITKQKDIIKTLSDVKKLCEDENIVEGDGGKFILGSGYNPLEDGDNENTLLKVAKDLGYIEAYQYIDEDICIDFDDI